MKNARWALAAAALLLLLSAAVPAAPLFEDCVPDEDPFERLEEFLCNLMAVVCFSLSPAEETTCMNTCKMVTELKHIYRRTRQIYRVNRAGFFCNTGLDFVRKQMQPTSEETGRFVFDWLDMDAVLGPAAAAWREAVERYRTMFVRTFQNYEERPGPDGRPTLVLREDARRRIIDWTRRQVGPLLVAGRTLDAAAQAGEAADAVLVYMDAVTGAYAAAADIWQGEKAFADAVRATEDPEVHWGEHTAKTNTQILGQMVTNNRLLRSLLTLEAQRYIEDRRRQLAGSVASAGFEEAAAAAALADRRTCMATDLRRLMEAVLQGRPVDVREACLERLP